MKRVAEASKPPVVIPVVVVAIDVHVALVIPAVEGGNCVRCRPWHCLSNILEAESYLVS